jgi:hypothetical protein
MLYMSFAIGFRLLFWLGGQWHDRSSNLNIFFETFVCCPQF